MNGELEKPVGNVLDIKRSVEPSVDLGNLLVEDLEAVDQALENGRNEEYLMRRMRDNAQVLLNHLWLLPKSRKHDSTVVELPSSIRRLPREKPLPKKRPPTRWEEFAQMKGIRKRKKDRMVWDDVVNDWRPSWGYKRANDDTKDWLIELPDQADAFQDYIGKRLEAKKERVAKNELQRLKNVARSTRPSSMASIGLGPQSKVTSKKEAYEKVDRARNATASAGLFTARLRGEKETKPVDKKRKFLPNETNFQSENDRYSKILNDLERKKQNLNVDKAVRLVNQQKTSDSVEKVPSESKKKKKKRPSGTKKGQNRYNNSQKNKKIGKFR